METTILISMSVEDLENLIAETVTKCLVAFSLRSASKVEDSFVYSCTYEQQYSSYEQFIPYHVLSFQFSGETHIQHQNGRLVLKKNQLLLTQKNQLAKSVKIPAADKVYKCISVIIMDTALQQYASNNSIHEIKNYTGEKNILLKPDVLLKSYFQSLLPYVEEFEKTSKKLAAIKTNEAIELLLHLNPSLKSFLVQACTTVTGNFQHGNARTDRGQEHIPVP